MNAVILAAGRGKRLGEATRSIPKCLVDIGGQSILEHQINALESIGIERYVIVVGYHYSQVINEATRLIGERASFAYNSHYNTTNTSYSLWLALNKQRDSFYYLNGDVLFSAEILDRIESSPLSSVLALDVKRCGSEEVKVVLIGDRVVQVSKEVPREIASGEFIGIARFDGQLVEALFRSLDLIVNASFDRMAYFEKGLELTLGSNYVGVVNISDLPAVEIDFPADLRYARDVILPQLQQLAVVG